MICEQEAGGGRLVTEEGWSPETLKSPSHTLTMKGYLAGCEAGEGQDRIYVSQKSPWLHCGKWNFCGRNSKIAFRARLHSGPPSIQLHFLSQSHRTSALGSLDYVSSSICHALLIQLLLSFLLSTSAVLGGLTHLIIPSACLNVGSELEQFRGLGAGQGDNQITRI